MEGKGHDPRFLLGDIIDEGKSRILYPFHAEVDDLGLIPLAAEEIGQGQDPHGHVIDKGVFTKRAVVVFKFGAMDKEAVHLLPPVPRADHVSGKPPRKGRSHDPMRGARVVTCQIEPLKRGPVGRPPPPDLIGGRGEAIGSALFIGRIPL